MKELLGSLNEIQLNAVDEMGFGALQKIHDTIVLVHETDMEYILGLKQEQN